MTTSPWRRLLRLRPLAALILCLPGLLLVGWTSWRAYAGLDAYRRLGDGGRQAITVEDFQLALHDVLLRDLRRMLMPDPPERSRLERLVFHLGQQAVAGIFRDQGADAERSYVNAELETPAGTQAVEMRLRGERHWNLLGAQRSLKVKLPAGDLYAGHRVFNLINDPSPMVVGEELILDLARDNGLVTPRGSFVRVFLNGADLGVMRFESQPDEGLLRMRRRIPGSIYVSDLPGRTPAAALWADTAHWKKEAASSAAAATDLRELERLLTVLRAGTHRAFVDFARRELDLTAFATLDALDIAFGSEEHDFVDNHRLYFDRYRGRFEPIAQAFRGYKHDRHLNLTENPLLLRLKTVPGYLSLRGRILHRLLVGEASTAALSRRGRRALDRLAPELASDPHLDAYKLLPGIDRFHRQMLRPLTVSRAQLVQRSELVTYEIREAFLLRALERNPLGLAVAPAVPLDAGSGPGFAAGLTFVVDGEVGVELEGLRVTWPAGCSDPRPALRRGPVPLPSVADGALLRLSRPWPLEPRVELVARAEASRAKGAVRAVPAPAAHHLTLVSSCPAVTIEGFGRQLATGSRIRAQSLPAPPAPAPDRREPAPDDVPSFTAGELAPEPETLTEPGPETIRLGPGVVEVGSTRVFEPRQSVEVAAGTTLRLAAGASLVFLGPVRFNGTSATPIAIVAAGPEPFGGLALVGPHTAGSVLRHVEIRGGTVPAWRLVDFPAMIDLHHTRDVTIRHCRFGANRSAHDVLHVADVENLLVEDTVVAQAAVDAIDVEQSTVVLRRVALEGSGDDALDLMGSRVALVDSWVVGAAGNAVSSGEETSVEVRDTLLAEARVGVLAKNASSARLKGTLITGAETALRVYRRESRYAGESRIEVGTLWAVDCARTTRSDDDSSREALAVGRIERRLPQDHGLDHLLLDVLGLSGPDALAAFVAARRAGRAP